MVDLTAVGSCFGEEKFTYIRLFGSLTNPHVLPLYIPNKLLAWELAYQITVVGMSKTLRDSKKHMWPTFPLRCGAFTLHAFKHVEKEAEKIKLLSLATIPKRKYDPEKVVYNVNSQSKIARFDHEEDSFDDLLGSTEIFSQVKEMSKTKLGTEGLEKFNRLEAQRLEILPIDLLETTSMARPQGYVERKLLRML